MRSLFFLSAATALTFASPLPQQLDFSLVDAVATPSNVTIPSDVTSENVAYNSDDAASTVQSSVLAGADTVDISDSTTNSTSVDSTLKKRGTCAAQPSGSGPVPSPDTASAFLSYSAFASAASAAATPSGYTQAFKNLNASNNAYGYLGFTTLPSYDTGKCAQKCNAISGCASFNLYFERDPSKDPGSGCENPDSTTNIKCVFWGGPVTSTNANNAGQWRSQFEVVIAGSNGYVNNTIEPADGFASPAYFGSAAIDAPQDCNGQSTFLGSEVFTGGPFDASLCAAACNAQSATNIKDSKATCKFFNTYILARNDVAIGQYCNLYSQTWSSTYATYKGAKSGDNKYTVSYSYGFSSSADAGTCKKATTSTWVVSSATSAASTATAVATTTGGFIDWKTFKANGANLGGWLEKEQTHDPIWWASVVNATEVPDEWTLCETLGEECGPTLEARYSSFLNKTTIDQLAEAGVNTLRIPTTYAAWILVPGSEFYHGNQQTHLKIITDYAIKKYGMHVIIGLHSLPGGVNNLDIGEALMHDAWFNNASNLDYSYKAIDAMLDFVKNSGNVTSWTIAPINEASDNLPGFGTSAGLSASGAQYIADYVNGVLARVAAVDSRIPVMIQDCFKGAAFWEPYFDAKANLVVDSHVYYFAAAGTYSQYVAPTVCGQAAFVAEATKFPNFIGEWSLQTMYNNSYADRELIFNTQRYAWNKYVSGGAFWTAVSYSTALVDGQGTQRDYWSYIDLINAGVIVKDNGTGPAYC